MPECNHCFDKKVTYQVEGGYSQLPMKLPIVPFITDPSLIKSNHFLVDCPFCSVSKKTKINIFDKTHYSTI